MNMLGLAEKFDAVPFFWSQHYDAIIAIARHLRIQVIAEGIEAYQQVEILRRLGCTVGQGFLFARPMPAGQCLELLGANAETKIADDEDMLAVFSAGRG
jgi:predicted signal transduction protein with EAL and GGDEF domain